MPSQLKNYSGWVCKGLLFLASLLPTISTAEEWKVPPALKSLVDSSAGKAVDSYSDGIPNSNTKITEQWNSILLLTVADALHKPGYRSVHDLKATKSSVEVSRTDKRSGASGKSDATTTLVEKAGIPRLISLALERGAAEGNFDGTNLSLTTTPYSLITLFIDDSQSNYEKLSMLSRIGLSATFAVDNDDFSETRTNRDNLNEFSIVLLVEGDRSTRSKAFNALWDVHVNKLLEKRIKVLTTAQSKAFDGAIEFMAVMDGIQDVIHEKAKELLEINRSLARNEQIRLLSEEVLNVIRVHIFEPLVSGELVFPDSQKATIRNGIVKAFVKADTLLVKAQFEAAKLIAELRSQRVMSLVYTQQRELSRPSLSEIKLLINQPIAGNELYANAFVTLNHNTDEEQGKKTIHDYGGSISWERKLTNLLTGDLGKADVVPITLSLDARLSHIRDANFERFTAQLRLTIPLSNGFVVPSSFRYDSRGLDGGNSEFQISFGLALDIDKLIAFAQL